MSFTGFFTLTFVDQNIDTKTALDRWHSLTTNGYNRRYRSWLRVLGRNEQGAVHIHALAATREDIREGTDIAGLRAKKRGAAASATLREEWRFLRRILRADVFGLSQFLPVARAGGAAGYLANHLLNRDPRDYGYRLREASEEACALFKDEALVNECIGRLLASGALDGDPITSLPAPDDFDCHY